MDSEGSRLEQPVQQKREKLEDRYGKIGIPAVVAAVGATRKDEDRRQMSAEMTRLQQMAQS